MTLKQQVYQHYQQQIQDKIDAFQGMIQALTIDAQNDAKGSAGDKHETALSMMHLEQEKINHKLKEFLEQKAILDKIDSNINNTIVSLGCIVKTNGLYLFICSAMPKIIINGITIIAISPQSPLGSLLLGQKVGFSTKINQTNYSIEQIM